MQASDGNLVLYHGNQVLWASGAAGAGAYAAMQGDGNFVIYNDGAPLWSSNTAGFSGAYLRVQDDSNLVIYAAGHPIWDWGSGYMGDLLADGWTLGPGAYLLSSNHQYELVMQASDGNLVLYQGGKALWAAGAAGAGAYAVMQSDGNFVVYNNGVAKWASGTAGSPGAVLQLQDDSNLVVYQGSTALWDYGTGLLSPPSSGGTPALAAISWAQHYLGADYDNGYCLAFVASAWAAAGVSIGGAATAADYWSEDPAGYAEHPGNTSPPVGALVFWGPTNVDGYSNPAGHVGIYVGAVSGIGTDEVISTWSWPEPESSLEVHYFSLSARNGAGYPYLGWMLP